MLLDRWNNIGGWYWGIYYSFHDEICWVTSYTIKLNKWRSKRKRKFNLKKIEECSGGFSLCRHCDGNGWSNNSFISICNSCGGTGLVDWVSRIR